MRFRRTVSAAVSAALLVSFSTGAMPAVYRTEHTAAAEYSSEVHTCGEWSYVVSDEGARVVGFSYAGSDPVIGELRLPTELDGHKVVSFAEGTFDECKIAYRITISDPSADYDAYWLQNSTVGELCTDEITYLLDHENNKYASVLTWNCLQTGDDPEADMTPQDVVIPDYIAGYPVKELGNKLFANAKNLGKLTLSDNITYLDSGIFTDSSITSVNIPKNVDCVPVNCFKGCTSLKEVQFHDDMFIVSYNAFEDCPCYADLPEEYKDKYSRAYDSPDYFDGTKRFGDWVLHFERISESLTDIFDRPAGMEISLAKYVGTADSGSVTIPKQVDKYVINAAGRTTIFDDDGNGVEEIVFEEGVTVIPSLQSSVLKKIVRFPDSVTELGPSFKSCKAIQSVVIPPNIKKLDGTFIDCTSLKEVTFEGDEVSLGLNTFLRTAITELELPGNCFLRPQGLPDTLEEIRFRAGENVTIDKYRQKPLSSLKRLIFSPYIKSVTIDPNVFADSGLETVQFPDGKVTIGSNAFSRSKALKEVVINGGADIGDSAFAACSDIEKVVLKGDCTVADHAFASCKSLTGAEFDVDSGISGRCFDYCPALYTINGIEVVPEGATEPASELADYFYGSCQSVSNTGFVNRFVLNRVKKIVAENTDDSMTEMQKAKALHDWVCENTVYDLDDNDDLENHVDSSVLMDGIAVCEGYARTYNLLLHEVGIESVFVRNSAHAWNIVKLGGQWFHVDTTWDDGDKPKYEWFLLSDGQMRGADEFHGTWELYCPTDLHSFQPEALPECVTVMGDIDSDGTITFADVVKLRDDIIAKADYSVIGDMSFDGRLSSADIAAVLQRVDGLKHLMGDVNGDGKVDSSDASAVLGEYARLSVSAAPVFTEEQTVSGDLNADGRTDSSDASAILSYYSYCSTGGTDSIDRFLK